MHFGSVTTCISPAAFNLYKLCPGGMFVPINKQHLSLHVGGMYSLVGFLIPSKKVAKYSAFMGDWYKQDFDVSLP